MPRPGGPGGLKVAPMDNTANTMRVAVTGKRVVVFGRFGSFPRRNDPSGGPDRAAGGGPSASPMAWGLTPTQRPVQTKIVGWVPPTSAVNRCCCRCGSSVDGPLGPSRSEDCIRRPRSGPPGQCAKPLFLKNASPVHESVSRPRPDARHIPACLWSWGSGGTTRPHGLRTCGTPGRKPAT